MVRTADAVVIGAGVNGASTAYNLVKAGLRKVVLLEKGLIASGGTGRSAASSGSTIPIPTWCGW